MPDSSELNLKAAVSLLSETAEQTGDIQSLIKARGAAKDVYKESFWAGVRAQSRFYQEIGQLEQKLEQAIILAREATDANPHVTVSEEGVELSPESVIANAYFQKGLLNLGQERWKDARQWFEQSLSVMDHPSAQLYLGHTVAIQGYREDAVTAFQQVIDTYPEGEEAVEATKALADLRQMKPKKWQTALLLSIFLGWCGADRFYLGDMPKGILKLITAGGFYVWWLIDIVRIATNTLHDANGMRLEK